MFEHAHVHRDHQLMFVRITEKKRKKNIFDIYLVKFIYVCVYGILKRHLS
jgi:hypothetical protein